MDKLVVTALPTPSEMEIRCRQAGLDPATYLIAAGDKVRAVVGEFGNTYYGTVLYVREDAGVLQYVIVVDGRYIPEDADAVEGDILVVPINGWPLVRVDGSRGYWASVTKIQ